MKKIIYPIITLLLLVACGGSDSDPINQEMSITSCYVVRNNNLSENFSSPIGLYILDPSGQPYSPDKNKASLVSNSWILDSPVYITGAGKLYAYYPCSPTDNPPLLNVDISNQIDLLYSKTSVDIAVGSSSLSIKLYHALSQLQVTVENEEIAELSVRSPLVGKFNILTGIYSDLTFGESTSTSGSMLVIPHTAAGTELKITLKSGSEYTYSIDGMSFVPGENYKYDFKLNENREQLEIRSFSVEEWVNGFTHQDYLKR